MRVSKVKKPCSNCAYKSIEACKTKVRCGKYLPITPNCSNCAYKNCSKKNRVVVCKKWEPDGASPFVTLLKELSNVRSKNISDVTSLFDDRDFKEAPNFITFCLDHLQVEPFPKQIEKGSQFFADICYHCSNPKYLTLYDESIGNILDNIQFLKFGKCDRCGRTRFDIIKENPDKTYWYNELIGVAGQRSGKSQLAGQLLSYIWQRYTKLGENPSKFFGLLNTKLHMTLVALTFGQAKKNLWEPFYDYIKDSPWFTDYHKAMNDKSSELGMEPVVKFPDTFLVYRHKNMECSPAGPDKRVLRGPTRIAMAIDELGWFTGNKAAIKINPDEVYNALSNSLATLRGQFEHLKKVKRRYHLPTAYAIDISSPSSARDKIMRLLYQSRKIKTMCAFHHPTWEMNPRLPRSHILFETEFAKNPRDANRDFGALPPLTENPFIGDISPIKEVAIKRKNMFEYKLVMIRSKSGKKYVSIRLKRIIPRNKPILIGVDAGRSGNAFAITATSYNSQGQLVLEGAIEVKPVPGMPVNFQDVYNQALRPILKTQTVPALLVDQWQSIDLIDKVDSEFGDKTDAIRYSLSYGDFEAARQRLLGEQIVLPIPEIKSWKTILKGIQDYEEFFLTRPISHLYLQLATVQDTGRRVEKSGDLDDDIFRALMLCIRFTFDEKDGYKYELMQFANDTPYATEILGLVRSRTTQGNIQVGRQKANTLAKNSMGNVAGISGRMNNMFARKGAMGNGR